jgi:hypothetical protein
MQNFSNPFMPSKLGMTQTPQVREELRELLPAAVLKSSKLVVKPIEEHQSY